MRATKVVRIVILPVLVIVLCFAPSMVGCGAEHPTSKEHPTGAKAEHPTQGKAAAPALSKDDLADAIEAWVKKQGGTVKIEDPETNKSLTLTLVKVHRERLSKVGADAYFACADFKAEDGTVYDIDVFMRGADKNNLTFAETTIHKVNGKERYTWYEEGGVWKKKLTATKSEAGKAKQP